jgi:hypothetical protein
MKKRNSNPVGTEAYYLQEAKNAGFKTVKEWLDHEYKTRPKCPYCGIPKGFAMGTGDCGCGED